MSYTRALILVLSDITKFLLPSGTKKSLSAPLALSLPSPAPKPQPQLTKIRTRTDVPVGHEPLVPPLSTHTTAYSAYDDVPLYQGPIRALDTVCMVLPYAAPVVVERHEGQFTQVVVTSVRGWVYKDALIYNEQEIFPHLQVGQCYDAHHVATIAIRRFLRDLFAATDLVLPLLPAEYVSYRLVRLGRTIAWPAVRPRPPGRWHELLRSVSGVQTGIVPRTGALMEWVDDEGEGALRFVEAVYPDQSVLVSGIINTEGCYDTVRFTEADWRSFRPVFIMVG